MCKEDFKVSQIKMFKKHLELYDTCNPVAYSVNEASCFCRNVQAVETATGQNKERLLKLLDLAFIYVLHLHMLFT